MEFVAIHPDLARLAAKSKNSLSFLVWAVLRQEAIKRELSTHYTKSDVRSILRAYGLDYTDRHFRRLLNDGDNLFWGINEQKLYLRSFEIVAKRLTAKIGDSDKVFDKLEYVVEIKVQKSAAAQNAEIYWSWFFVHGEKVISRETLADLFGFSHDQQRHYEKLLRGRLRVNSNYAHIDAKAYKKNPQNLPEHHFTIEFEREVRFSEKIEAITAIQYQLPNSFLARPKTSGDSPSVLASNAVRKATRKLMRHTLAAFPQKRSYWLSWKDFEYAGGLNDFVRCFFQGKKRLFLSGQYL